MFSVKLKKGKAKPFWSGHPLVYSGAIERIEGAPEAGALVAVTDNAGREIGMGVFNPHSQYRVRILALAAEKAGARTVPEILARRLKDAASARSTLGLPSDETTVFRLLNSEGDRCSGLTIDHVGGTLVVASSAFWAEQYRAEITAAMQQVLAPEHIVWRQVHGPLVQDGWTKFDSANGESAAVASRVEVLENGVKFLVDVGTGQKTGFYCDQRENRRLVRSMAKGRRVLDLYCYTGGFALSAAAGGAAQVVGVDTSESAIALARENAALNQVSSVEFQVSDAHAALAAAKDFDFIILDPPKFAATADHVPRALKQYRLLAHAALEKLPAGGLLLLCSCSAALTHVDLIEAIRDAAADCGARPAILAITHHAPDHPVLPAFPEGAYLHAVLVRMG